MLLLFNAFEAIILVLCEASDYVLIVTSWFGVSANLFISMNFSAHLIGTCKFVLRVLWKILAVRAAHEATSPNATSITHTHLHRMQHISCRNLLKMYDLFETLMQQLWKKNERSVKCVWSSNGLTCLVAKYKEFCSIINRPHAKYKTR